MKIFNLSLILIFYSVACFGDICSESKCPNGREPIDICIVDPDTYRGDWKVNAAATCGYFTEKIITNKTGDVSLALERLAKECKSLDRLTAFGHGEDGIIKAGDLNAQSVQKLSRFSCLFNEGAKIQLRGCNVGRGCLGDMFLYQTAKALLGRGGNVSAPTYYASTAFPLWPHTSINLKDRFLEHEGACADNRWRP